jgi:predicted GIY-YIG superfamily endonuclease
MIWRATILGEAFTAVDLAETKYFDLPCVYLMAHEERGLGPRIHYVGQTHSLKERFASHHQLKAAIALGATHALVLVVQSQRDRLEFETMLRWELRPPLNEEDIPRHIQAWRAAMHCGKPHIAERAKALHFSRAQPMMES